MFFPMLLSSVFPQLGRKPRGSKRPAPHHRPCLEVLEDRTVPSSVQGLQTVPSPDVHGLLSATAIIAPNDIWAVGWITPAGSSTLQPLAEHFNGTSWSVVPTPKSPGSYFTRLSALSSNDVWAVGNDPSTNSGLIEHWDGTKWSIVTNPVSGTGGWLTSVDAIAAKNVWAVGFTAGHSLIEHFDGSSWSVVPISLPNNSELSGVSGSSANDIWAVGHVGSVAAPEILHFNGTSWSTVASAPVPSDSSLMSVSALAPNDAWAVGVSDHGNTLIEHFDGTSWSVVPSPNSTAQLLSVSAVSANNVWAVGYTVDPTTGLEQGVTEHWDGTSWSVLPTPSSSQNQQLRGVATDSLGDVVVVGLTFNTSTSQPVIMQASLN